MNTKQRRLAQHLALCLAVIAGLAGCAHQPAAAPPAAASPQAAAEPADAPAILQRMAGFLARSQHFSVSAQGSYDVLQASGQKIEFGEKRRLVLSRPNFFRVEGEHGNGEKQILLFNGKDVTLFNPGQNIYAQASKVGSLDDTIIFFVKDLGMRLPLAVIFLSNFPDEIARRTQALDYVEKTELDGKPAHHLAGRTETVDYQVWVAMGNQPVPLRIVLTYKNAEGQPQFRAQFFDWNFAPAIDESLFAFTPPKDARRIPFLKQIPEIQLQGAASPEKTGGKK